ncbi:MAG: hypothetical protein HON65_16550 [Rhodospirillales bacterium]|nr:hypothetical protein [Rhodospirillales bacterium]
MSQSEQTNELVKRATSAALKALAEEVELEVNFSQGAPGIAGKTAHLPTPPHQMNKESLSHLRGSADALAMRIHYHNEKIHRSHLPYDPQARLVFEAIEQARCESLGARRMTGVSSNLQYLNEERSADKNFDALANRHDDQFPDVLSMLVRERLGGLSRPESSAPLFNMWKEWLDEDVLKQVDSLQDCMNDQEQFADRVIEMLQTMEILDADHSSNPDQQNEEDGSEEPEGGDELDGESGEMDSESMSSMDTSAGDAEEDAQGMSELGDEESTPGDGEEEPSGPSQWPRNQPDQPNSVLVYAALSAKNSDDGQIGRLRRSKSVPRF